MGLLELLLVDLKEEISYPLLYWMLKEYLKNTTRFIDDHLSIQSEAQNNGA